MAFLDTTYLVSPDEEQAFLAEFEQALTLAADKRDCVAHRLAQLENQQAFAAAEIKRLQAFKKSAEAKQTRLEGYVSYVIQRSGLRFECRPLGRPFLLCRDLPLCAASYGLETGCSRRSMRSTSRFSRPSKRAIISLRKLSMRAIISLRKSSIRLLR